MVHVLAIVQQDNVHPDRSIGFKNYSDNLRNFSSPQVVSWQLMEKKMIQSNFILGENPLIQFPNLVTEVEVETFPLEIIKMIFENMEDLFTLQNQCAVSKEFRELALEIFPTRLQYKFALILNRFKSDDAAKTNDIFRNKLDKFVVGIFLGKTISALRHEVGIKFRELDMIRLRPNVCHYEYKLYNLNFKVNFCKDEDFYSPAMSYCLENKEMKAFVLNNPNVLKLRYSEPEVGFGS